MEDFQIYILQVNAGLVVFYLLYRMLFSRDTFLRIRRLFLFSDLVDKTQFDALFTFIFSPRPGTPAAKMPDPVSREEKQVWFEKLVDAQNAISAKKHASYIGRTVKVLVDGESDDAEFPLAARTEGNRLVRMKGDKALIGTFAKAKITDSNTWALYGEAVEE